MWIVRLALTRPYTIAVMALLILIMGVLSILRTPTDIFPNINIPVVNVIWSYKGLSTDEMDKMITNWSESTISSNVSNVSKIESQTHSGVAVVKIFFQPDVKIEEAVTQAAASAQSIIRRMPNGTQPPLILRYNATDVPILQLGFSSDSLSEAQVYDYVRTRIRPKLKTVRGTRMSVPFGGKSRQIQVDLAPDLMMARGVTPEEIVNAVSVQNLTLPGGSARLGEREYSVRLNSRPEILSALNDIPIKQVNGVTIHMRDVAYVHDGSDIQANIIKEGGVKGTLISITKSGNASTTAVVDEIRNKILPEVRAAAPKSLKIVELSDQSVFVKASIHGVVVEGIIAAMLTAAMILLFLGSWRSTLIVAISIPLSILASLIIMYLLGETLNIMTLSGLALAIGILVDDATVTIENIHRNQELGLPLRKAIVEGAQQIATPTLVATLTICIVFISVLFLEGPAYYLFGPMAMAIVFAMLASYLLSRTLVPTLADLLLASEDHAYSSQGRFYKLHTSFNKAFERLQTGYMSTLRWTLTHRKKVLVIFVVVVAFTACLVPFTGRDFFPTVDAGQFRLHMRAPAGLRLEETEKIAAQVEGIIRETIPEEEVESIISNIGLTAEAYNFTFIDNATLGSSDAELLVALSEVRSKPTLEYTRKLRDILHERLPEVTFFYQASDIVTQILNFGLTASIDVQVIGNDRENNVKVARAIQKDLSLVPGIVDARLHQVLDAPELFLEVDRERAIQFGMSERQIANNLMISLSGSAQVQPNYWSDPKTGYPYLIAVQTPPNKLASLDQVLQTPLVLNKGEITPQLLSNVTSIKRKAAPVIINRYNTELVYDVYASVEKTDLGSVSGEIDNIVAKYNEQLKPGNKIVVNGQVESMKSAFTRLGIGLVFAALLVYLLMVVNFQSFRLPFIIITALPGAMCGMIWMLFLTQTPFSIPSLMGTIMSVGVATANSILMVNFASDTLQETNLSPFEAALEAGRTRLRPILMTALAMIIGMLPMSLGLGEGGEQNAPLGRAVIGGLLLATVTTLLFVPVVFSYLAKKKEKRELELVVS
ncbi:efflux RND transporter permease subunit [Pontibacter silvestris]|uniref:Efflux RND transporter permease subunit n=1 Tax=Pontibacter silvestris TaxID=2305183 RepID=A0ABW4WXW7_9BACT|nr:efflux RND transporter permease subunit [Pontibacter silvestris]MCC9135393.1 efflux RND transporter permease subunit [Pontibacter silvestris]